MHFGFCLQGHKTLKVEPGQKPQRAARWGYPKPTEPRGLNQEVSEGNVCLLQSPEPGSGAQRRRTPLLRPTRLSVHGRPRPECWRGHPLPPAVDLPKTQGSDPGLPRCRQILYCRGRQGRPRMLEWAAYPFSGGSSRPRNRTGFSCIAGRFFTN